MNVDASLVADHAARIRDRISAAGGDPERVSLLAVTKGFGPEAPLAALEAGLDRLGENYAQELVDKAAAVAAAGHHGHEWHFIGRLQSNKVRSLADLVTCWQSVDRRSLVRELSSRAPGAKILVQVNAAGETQKGGCAPAATAELVDEARAAGLVVAGLMTVGVQGDDRATASAFETVSSLADDLDLPERSMGMSDDLEAAVRAGSTMIRVGRALFGPRPPHSARRSDG